MGKPDDGLWGKLFDRIEKESENEWNSVDAQMTDCQSQNDNITLLCSFCNVGVVMKEFDFWLDEEQEYIGASYPFEDTYDSKDLTNLLKYKGSFYKEIIETVVNNDTLDITFDNLTSVFTEVLDEALKKIKEQDRKEKDKKMNDKLVFEVLNPDADGRNPLLNEPDTVIASLKGDFGEVELRVACKGFLADSDSTILSWKGKKYEEVLDFPSELIEYLRTPFALNRNNDLKAGIKVDLESNFSFCFYDDQDELGVSYKDSSTGEDMFVEVEPVALSYDNSTGKINFKELKEQMKTRYKEVFKDEIEKETVISPKEYIEQGGKTTSNKEDLAKEDKEKD